MAVDINKLCTDICSPAYLFSEDDFDARATWSRILLEKMLTFAFPLRQIRFFSMSCRSHFLKWKFAVPVSWMSAKALECLRR